MILQCDLPSNVIQELTRKHSHAMKVEALYALSNMITFTTYPNQVQRLIQLGLITYINQELYYGGDHGILQIICLECLTAVFRKLPNEA